MASKPDRPKLIRLYWGDNGLPGEWMSFGQMAEALEMGEEEVRALMGRYKIRLRGNYEEAHLLIWNLLVGDWNMEFGRDFLYRTKVNNRKIDFFLTDDVVGITVKLRSHGHLTVECRNIGEAMMFELTVSNDTNGLEGMGNHIVDILRRADVKKRLVEISRDDQAIW